MHGTCWIHSEPHARRLPPPSCGIAAAGEGHVQDRWTPIGVNNVARLGMQDYYYITSTRVVYLLPYCIRSVCTASAGPGRPPVSACRHVFVEVKMHATSRREVSGACMRACLHGGAMAHGGGLEKSCATYVSSLDLALWIDRITCCPVHAWGSFGQPV